MAISKACYVICDECGDPAEISTEGADMARSYAKAQGFVRVKRDGKMVDLCQRHSGVQNPKLEGELAAMDEMQRQNRSGRLE